MFKTLKRIADALESQNKILNVDDKAYEYLKKILDKQNDVSEKLIGKISNLWDNFGSLDLSTSGVMMVNGDGHLCTIDISIDTCYFSGKHCVETDNDRVALLIITQDGKSKKSQALKEKLPKGIKKHGDYYIYLEDSYAEEK